MRKPPRSTRNSSSSTWWRCQTNSPRNFTTLTCCPFSSPTILGLKYSENDASFWARLTLRTEDRLPHLGRSGWANHPQVHQQHGCRGELSAHGEHAVGKRHDHAGIGGVAQTAEDQEAPHQ